MTTTPPAPIPKLTRLDAAKKRALKAEALRLAGAKEDLTVEALQRFAVAQFQAEVTAGMVERVLGEAGYFKTDDVVHVSSDEGRFDSHRTWRLSPTGKPLTPAERTKLLDQRVRVLAEAYVQDLMDDPQLEWASLEERAVEGTRIFANLLSDAVLARAKIGARTILPSCGETAAITFRSLAPRG